MADDTDDNVVKLVPGTVGDAHVFESNFILDKAKEKLLVQVVVVGKKADGTIYTASSHNAGEAVMLLMQGQHSIVFDV